MSWNILLPLWQAEGPPLDYSFAINLPSPSEESKEVEKKKDLPFFAAVS